MPIDSRVWMYRRGEARLFEHPAHIPRDEGWQRFPLPDENRPGLPADVFPPEPPSDPNPNDREKLDRMSRRRLTRLATHRGIRFDSGWTRTQLKQAILEALNDNRA